MPAHRLNWDNIVALGYAAEQLFMAAQLLTSDTVPRESGLTESCTHLRRLTEHRALLPSDLIISIQECLENCSELSQSRPPRNGRQSPEELADCILQVLNEVRRVLQEQTTAVEVAQRAA